VFKYLLQPRFYALHVLTTAVAYGFGWLGFWQWQSRIRVLPDRSEIVDWQNTFYAIQWWFFALFVIWFWWKFLSDGRKLERAAKNK
jgi:hypothetical protein